MDQAGDSPDPLQRAGSSEPSSTRPNPFDDSDIASRKRRRTSQSGSPSRSVDGTDAELDNASSGNSATLDGDHEATSNIMNVDGEMVNSTMSSQQPDPPSLPSSTSEPTSSKVTINLRSPPQEQDHNILPSPSNPISYSKDGVGHEADDSPGPAKSNSSKSASPPMELVQIPDAEDDVLAGRSIDEVTIIGQTAIAIDPTDQFPYHDSQEYRYETIQRLVHYIATSTSTDENVIASLQRWFSQFLTFAKNSDRNQLVASLRNNRHMWLVFPDIISAVRERKYVPVTVCPENESNADGDRPSPNEDPDLRERVFEFQMDFAQLAAILVDIDISLLHSSLGQMVSGESPPELFAGVFLHHLHLLTRRDNLVYDDECFEISGIALGVSDDKASLVKKFDSALNGSIGRLDELATLLVGALPSFPKLLVHLAHVTEMVFCVAQLGFCLPIPQSNGVARRLRDLGTEHRLFTTASTCLEHLIEKKVTQLTVDGVSCMISSLAELLKVCMQGNHRQAEDILTQHQNDHGYLPGTSVPEAVSFEWRFDVLGKLIRSSQMQLRVLAATTMCNELVNLWRRLGEQPDNPLLKHLGTYLLRSQIIEYIIGPNCHPEIIVESSNIVGFLVVTKIYHKGHTDRLWQGVTSSPDPRVSEALARLVTTIMNLFENQTMLEFCEKFCHFPMESFTPPIRNLWEVLLRQMCHKAQAENRTLEYWPYELCVRLLRESSACSHGSQVASPELQLLAMQKFRELLNNGPDQDGREHLYMTCLEDVSRKSRTSLGSLWCLSMAIRPIIGREIHVLTQEHDLIRLIVEELEHAVATGKEMDIPAVLCGNTNQPRCDFVANIILYEPSSIDRETGKKLWNLLVGPFSLCQGDREAGWGVLNDVVRKSATPNPFIQTCLVEYLPSLPPECFCAGLLEFVKEEALDLVDVGRDFQLDDDATVSTSCLGQLWRIILTADDQSLVQKAIEILAVEVYLQNALLSTYASDRTRQVHSALVTRCFSQMREAARQIKSYVEGSSSGDEESMVIVVSEDKLHEQERIFTRSLQLLRYFHNVYQSKPHLAAPDLRSLMSFKPSEIEGDLAQLKYQSFDGAQHTEVRPLNIGRRNTAASLLASIREETGFQKYKAYYRGQPFLPDERQVCKSLEDLQIHEGLILVKREKEEDLGGSVKIQPGSSPLQIEIMGHFEEMWECLTLEDRLAREILDFLINLPADTRTMEKIEDDSISQADIFPPGQPFRTLYAMYTLLKYKTLAQRSNQPTGNLPRLHDFPRNSYEEARKRSVDLIVQAVLTTDILAHYAEPLQMEIASAAMNVLAQWFLEIAVPTEKPDPSSSTIPSLSDLPSPQSLIKLLTGGAKSRDDISRDLVIHTFQVLLQLGVLNEGFWDQLISDSSFLEVVHTLLIYDERKQIRATVSRIVMDFLNQELSLATMHSTGFRLADFFWRALSKVLHQTTIHPDQCHEVFQISNLILRHAVIQNRALDGLSDVAVEAGHLLLKHTSTEDIDQTEPFDPVAKGLAFFLSGSLQADAEISGSLKFRKLADGLFWKHLFPHTRSVALEPVPKVILNTDTRKQLCEIVFRLAKDNTAEFATLLTSMDTVLPFFVTEEDEPYLYETPPSFDRSRAVRAPCGYVGLRNLSNTCYLNSLLTQLYMNTGFRRFLLTTQVRDAEGSQQLLHFAKKVFGFMQESYRRFVDPTDLVSSIKNYDDSLIDIHNQMDVDEFYNLLFDRFEGQLLSPLERKELRSFYGGRLVQQIKSKECQHISERLDTFSAIQCDIKGKHSLQESLQAYVDGEVLEGDNKYKCSTCDRHVDAVKRACLKDLPDNMIFHLKRFDFNLRTLQRNKINDYFSFPPRIDLKPYTVDYLSDPDGPANKEEDIFELVGVLVHAGTAESGHYYSYIRERPSRPGRASWVEFNDDTVTPWDPAMMEASTFGGPDQRSTLETGGAVYDKSYSAYMLFYERASSLNKQEELLGQEVSLPLRLGSDAQQKAHILDENTVYLRRHCLFDPSHAELAERCFKQARLFGNETEAETALCGSDQDSLDGGAAGHKVQDLAMKVLLSHFDQVVTRKKDLPDFIGFSRTISGAIETCRRCALSFYEYYHMRHASFRSLIQRNPDQAVRQMTGTLFISSLKKISEGFPKTYYPALDSKSEDEHDSMEEVDKALSRRSSATNGSGVSVIEGSMEIFKYLWGFFQIHIRAWDDHFQTMLRFAQLGHRETAHLLAEDFLLKLFMIIAADASMELPANYSRMLNNILRRVSSRPPPYSAVIALIGHLLQCLEPILSVETIVESPYDRLDMTSAPFPWTSSEVSFLHQHPEKRTASFFVEKLLAIDQMHPITDNIIVRLTKSTEHMDAAIAQTLRNCLRRDDPQHPIEPFLRASLRYVESTHSQLRAEQLVTFVASQAKRMHFAEGMPLLSFFRMTLEAYRTEMSEMIQMHDHCLSLAPEWAPGLLVHPVVHVRAKTIEILELELFRHFDAQDADEDDDEGRPTDLVIQTTQRLGMACLAFLRDVYVRRRTGITREQAGDVGRVVANCALAFERPDSATETLAVEFALAREEVMDSLWRQIVEELEEDGSEWEGSCGSSEPMDGIADMSMQVMHDLNETHMA
ncbi:unnamed protein product [Clonostachys solani]|uniref:USP domain-containing protein n=1 Tax=Clonostachys solani TaxID=160281 RepID=A0A9N9W263_9HYPO|nr:unnamed protein product [Clonostachys solani]